MSTIIPATTSAATSAVTTTTSSDTTTSSTKSTVGVDDKTIAGNFQTFLSLLTTQLKNQNPLDPLDTNQFTSQLVQFAQVEQQLKSNDQLATLVSLQKSAQSTQALEYVGQTVAVEGTTAPLKDGSATWLLSAKKAATATITIKSSTGQTVYSTTKSLSADSAQSFVWDGKDSSDLQWPDGNYTISVTAQDTSGQTVAVSTEIEATVDSADLTQSPPLLSIAGETYTLDKLKRIIRK